MKTSLKRECRRHLLHTFGLTAYRPGQKEAVHAILSGRDVLCILPTGAGKSLCWQLPAVVRGGVTVVVSPLIALMRDQVRHLEALGIPSVSLDSLMTAKEKEDALTSIRQGRARIAFVSPERLEQPAFLRLCGEIRPWLVVVDEAHCVVQWGDGFRPAYAAIPDFLAALPRRPVVCAMTATADEAMQRAICSRLSMRRAKRIILPILRDNLIYRVHTTLDRTGDIVRLMHGSPCKTVIFCRSRARTEQLARQLKAGGIPAEAYHAGLERNERLTVQQHFQTGATQTLCATTAFGLGVDIPDIRRVIHDYLPDTLIEYVQHTGRAGRDQQEAECLLFLEPNELVAKAYAGQRARNLHPRSPLRRWVYLCRYWQRLNQLLRVLLQSTCIPAAITAAFGSKGHPCGHCSACCKGRAIRHVPSMAGKTPEQIRAWLLRWQRDTLAERLHCLPGKIATEDDIAVGAERFVFPDGAAVPPEMERLLRHFRRESMHASQEARI